MTLLDAAIAGIAAGFVHVLSGPDHLAAVAPFASRTPSRAWVVGFRWGLGHTAGVLIIGLLALLLRGLLPLELFSAWSERIVGVTLIVIGIWGFRSALRTRVHAHEHAHDGSRHAHVHVHAGGTHGAHDHGTDHSHGHAPLYVGVLHGVSGGSHLLGILPALALPDIAGAAAYLTAFGASSVAGMTAFSWAVGRIAHTAGARIAVAGPAILAVVSLAAVLVGGFWIYTSM
jgi:hypothetical protein